MAGGVEDLETVDSDARRAPAARAGEVVRGEARAARVGPARATSTWTGSRRPSTPGAPTWWGRLFCDRLRVFGEVDASAARPGRRSAGDRHEFGIRPRRARHPGLHACAKSPRATGPRAGSRARRTQTRRPSRPPRRRGDHRGLEPPGRRGGSEAEGFRVLGVLALVDRAGGRYARRIEARGVPDSRRSSRSRGSQGR